MIRTLLVLVLCAGALSCATDSTSPPRTARVVHVIDGDTLVVEIAGARERVRLCGVDAAELSRGGREPLPYGEQAREFLRNLLLNETVRMTADTIQPERGDYGRLLAYVYRLPDGLFANEELIRQGYARVYRRTEYRERKHFEELEEQARKSRRGLWRFSTQ